MELAWHMVLQIMPIAKYLLNPEVQEHQHMCVTLWHEILHVILDNAQIETEDDEYLIQTLATGIYQVISDNIGKFYDLVS